MNSSNRSLVRNRHGGATARHRCRVPERTTAERIATAWHHSSRIARQSFVAACATSLVIVMPMRSAAIVSGATAIVGVLLALAALVDAHERRLPNRLLAAAFGVALGGALLSFDAVVLHNALLGTAVAGGLLLVVRVTRGIGMGDVKMAAVIGASASACTGMLLAAPVAIALGAFAAAAYGVVTNRRRVALGPALWFGWANAIAVVAVLSSNSWLS